MYRVLLHLQIVTADEVINTSEKLELVGTELPPMEGEKKSTEEHHSLHFLILLSPQ
jgi:hypothetical protein